MKKRAFTAIAAVLILAGIAAWYFTPKTFAKGIKADEVAYFSVFDGQTGTGFQVTEPAYMKMIVRNLQGTPMKRSGISLGRMGYGFSVEGIDKNGKTVIPVLYINDSSTIRKDPFFYSCGGELCFDFLKELEPNASAEATLPGNAVLRGKITDFAGGTLYLTADSGSYFVDNWLAYIPTGPTFEIGDEVAIRYSGTATETAPAGLCGVTEIDLTDEEYIRKYGDASAEAEYPALILVQGVLYYDTSEISTSPRCGMLDGTISSVCDGTIPTEENQSNFGTGYGYQIGANRVEAFIDGKWHVFRPFVASEWESLPKEAETQPLTVPSAAEYPGVYQRTWREEIGGTVINLHSYIVLNEDHSGYWIAQDVGMLTWEDGQLTLTVGAVCDMALTREGETVNLLVSDGGEAPTVFEKIEELPEQIQSLLVRS